MGYLYYFILIVFSYLNILVMVSDYRYKKIPNKLLGYLILLLPFYYLVRMGMSGFAESLSIAFLLQIVLSLSVSFILYYFGIWSAGDAKYLLVLSLYIPYIGTLPFILNISLVTLAYLMGYFIYFLLMTLFRRHFRKSLWEKILIEQEDRLMNFLNHPLDRGALNKKTLIRIGRHIMYFLLFFVFLRLFRTEIIDGISRAGLIDSKSGLGSYFLVTVSIVTFLLIYYYRLIANKLKIIISKRGPKFRPDILSIINIALASSLLLMLIIYDYTKEGNEVFHKLYLILTYYLAISICIRISLYLYKIAFQIGEQNYIPINELKEGEIIDKNYLFTLFGEQECLGCGKDGKCEKGGMLYPDSKSYFMELENPVNEETIKKLKAIYDKVNGYHFANTTGYKEISTVKILYTFAFGGYIFTGFIITFIYGDGPVNMLLNTIFKLISGFFHR